MENVMEKLKRTPLYEEHIKLNAKMVPFGGWEMPVQYSSIIDEHLTVRNKVGLFDVSHMGEIFVSGPDSLKFLQKLVVQDISKLVPGKAVYTQLTNKNAGVIDDLIVYKLEEKEGLPDFLLVVNASRVNEDFSWIKSNTGGFNVTVINKSDDFVMIAVQGPLAADLIADLGLPKENQPGRFWVKYTKMGPFELFVSGTGYTGEDGFELIIKNAEGPKLWQELLAKGQKYGVKPIGLGARDTLRLEAAMMLNGQDMTEETTPVEASLSWSVPKNKQDDYFGKEKIMSQMEKTPENFLIGFKMLDRSIPRHEYEIYKDGNKVGHVTSGGVAPFVGANIGMGYVNTNKVSIEPGTKIDIEIRGAMHPAEIVRKPFYNKNRRNK